MTKDIASGSGMRSTHRDFPPEGEGKQPEKTHAEIEFKSNVQVKSNEGSKYVENYLQADNVKLDNKWFKYFDDRCFTRSTRTHNERYLKLKSVRDLGEIINKGELNEFLTDLNRINNSHKMIKWTDHHNENKS